MDWQKLKQILNYLTNTKTLIITLKNGEEIRIKAGTMAVDFCTEWIKIDSENNNPRLINWNQISMITFEFNNRKSLSLAL